MPRSLLEFDTVIEKDYDDSITVPRDVKLTVNGDVYRPIFVMNGGTVIVYGHVDSLTITGPSAKCYLYGTCRHLALSHYCGYHNCKIRICGGMVEHLYTDNGEIVMSGDAYIKEAILEPGRLIARGAARIDQVCMNCYSRLRIRHDTIVPSIKASRDASIELYHNFTSIKNFVQNHQLKQGVHVRYYTPGER